MPNPRLTGISSITGKTVYIRHATEADLITVQEYLKQREKSGQNLTTSDVVVAAEEDRIIGFGILEKPGPKDDMGCVMISEDGRRRGIGASIVRHLMAYAPVKTLYAATGKPKYFKRAGFSTAKKAARKGEGGITSLCRFPGKDASHIREYTRT